MTVKELIIWNIFYVLLPLLGGNVLHMLAVKKNALSQFNIPIWEKQFGTNKTWRGFLIMGVFTFLFYCVFEQIYIYNFSNSLPFYSSYWFAASLGLTYSLSELPNSWFKRKLGIAAGQSHQNRNKWLFLALDKLDSASGVGLLTFWFINHFGLLSFPFSSSIYNLALLILCNSLFHSIFSWILVFIKIKRSF